MHADIDERPERGDIGHHPFEHHAGLEVGHLLHAGGERRGGERRPRITTGLLQFGENVGDGGDPEAVVGEVRGPEHPQRTLVADQFGQRDPRSIQDASHHRVRLRMHAGGVKWVVAAADPEEPGTLLECFGAQAGNLQQRCAAAERAGRVAVVDDGLGQGRRDSRHPRQQRHRCGVQVHAHRVDRILDDRIQTARQRPGGDVVLVLPDTDRLRFDLDQFGQRVLQTARDRHRAAQGHVEAGQFVGRVGRGRVHRSAGFTHHGLDRRGGPGAFDVGDQFRGQGIGLPRRGAVAHGDQLDAVPGDQCRQRRFGGVPLVLRLVREDGAGVENLAGAVDDGHLDPGSKARVQAEGGTGAGRCREQQIFEVLGEDLHRVALGALPQPDAGVDGCTDHEPCAPRPGDGRRQPRCRGGLRGQVDTQSTGDQVLVGLVLTALEPDRQRFLFFSAQDGEHPVGRHALQRFAVLEVVAELLRRRAFGSLIGKRGGA